MSRVTISDLVADYKRDGFEEIYPHPIHHTEIVPRKIVETIIERCKKNEEALRPYYGEPFEDGQDVAYTDIRICAEQLLRQFEGDDE